MQFCRNACGTARIDLSGLRGEVLQELWVQVVHLLQRDVHAATRHAAIRTTKIDGSLLCFWTSHW